MSKSVRTKEVDHLFAAILSLETKEECYTFFEDVCTINYYQYHRDLKWLRCLEKERHI